MKAKRFLKEILIPCAAFILIFSTLLSILTLVFYPKWDSDESGGQMSGFYKEPENTLDVLFLGSCNMYTSISPVLMYEEFGITGYAFTCPDQELSTSYYYIKEALKTQKPKAVVLESLFFTQYNTKNRERYNRYALDYMPLTANKISAIMDLAQRESEHMKSYDGTAPDTLLTVAGYLFPILRYHSRADLSKEDFSFFFADNIYNTRKGNRTYYSLPLADDFCSEFTRVFNGDSINEITKEYFPKIKTLCEENNIPLVVIKSPNYMRWGHDDEITKIVREYVASQDVPFVDFHAEEYNNFIPEDYNASTTMNVYGDRKLTHTIAKYLIEHYGLSATKLSEKDTIAWNDCVKKFYAEAEDAGVSITAGKIAYIINTEEGTSVRWNPCSDCSSYDVYRALGKTAEFELVATVEDDFTDNAGELLVYDDKNVISGQGYTYFVVPNEGASANKASNQKYNVFVSMPTNYVAVNRNGNISLNWDKIEDSDYYYLYRRTYNDYTYSPWTKAEKVPYVSTQVNNGTMYTYRLTAVVEEDGILYHSESVYADVTSLVTPKIYAIALYNGGINIKWEAMKNVGEIEIWRKKTGEEDFTLYDVVKGTTSEYTNKNNVEIGEEYSYKIAAVVYRDNIKSVSEQSKVVSITAVK